MPPRDILWCFDPEDAMRPKGSSAQLEQRRRDALAMLGQGIKPARVARILRVSLVSVGRWRQAARRLGVQALAAKSVPGRPLKLSVKRRKQLLELLRQGPTHHGFGTELWTLERVATVIERRFDVCYHPSQVWRILRQLGWTCQKPQRRARERDEPAIVRWRRVQWPRIKKSVQIRQKYPVSRRDGPDAPAAGQAHLGAQRQAADPVLLGEARSPERDRRPDALGSLPSHRTVLRDPFAERADR